jgi:hypothetical protein
MTMPSPADVGPRAAALLTLIEQAPEYDRLVASTRLYPDCWATFTGYPIIAQFDLAKDAEPLFTEAMRVLALKTTVYQLTGGDEEAAELLVSAPVDEMVHAVLAQYTLVTRMTRRLGLQFVHMTDQERFGYEHDGYTATCYRAAGWGNPPARYWIDTAETNRRLPPEPVAAALLHDAPEYAPQPEPGINLYPYLTQHLGGEVARIVRELDVEHTQLDQPGGPPVPVEDLPVLWVSAADKIVALGSMLRRAQTSGDPAGFWRMRGAFFTVVPHLHAFHLAAAPHLPASMGGELGRLLAAIPTACSN